MCRVVVLLGAHPSLFENKTFGRAWHSRGSSTECYKASLELPLAAGDGCPLLTSSWFDERHVDFA